MADDKKAPARGVIVQKPEPITAEQVAANVIADAEKERVRQEEASRAEMAKTLPQNVLDEMEAGRQAIARHAPPKAG